jgi:hypothetical protein
VLPDENAVESEIAQPDPLLETPLLEAAPL